MANSFFRKIKTMQTTFTALWPRVFTRRPGFSLVYSVKSYGGEDGPRTHDLLNAIQTLSQTELQPHIADRLCVHDHITYWISNRISQNSYDLLSWWSTHSKGLERPMRPPIAVRITTTIWCPRRDSNPHGLPHLILSQARLPIPSLGQIKRICLFPDHQHQ